MLIYKLLELAVNFKMVVQMKHVELVKMKIVKEKMEQTQMMILKFCDISFFLFCRYVLCLLYVNYYIQFLYLDIILRL